MYAHLVASLPDKVDKVPKDEYEKLRETVETARLLSEQLRPRGFLRDAESAMNLGPKYQSVGSVTGSLDSITVHRGHEFRVWDEDSGKPVICRFPKEMLADIKDVLKNRVLVYGMIQRNSEGTPIAIQVEGCEKLKSESELPSIQEMSGLLDDATGGKKINDYLEDIRDPK